MKEAYVVSYCEQEFDGIHERHFETIIKVFTNCQQACDYVEKYNAELVKRGENYCDYGFGACKRYYSVNPYPLVD